jgi:hypothetical protein
MKLYEILLVLTIFTGVAVAFNASGITNSYVPSPGVYIEEADVQDLSAGATDGGLGSLAVVGWIFTFGGMIMSLFDAVFVGLPNLISSFGFPTIWVLAVFGSPLLFVAAWGLYGLMTGNQTKGQD